MSEAKLGHVNLDIGWGKRGHIPVDGIIGCVGELQQTLWNTYKHTDETMPITNDSKK